MPVSQGFIKQSILNLPVYFFRQAKTKKQSTPQDPNTRSILSYEKIIAYLICSLGKQKWYFVTKIVLTYCEKKLF